MRCLFGRLRVYVRTSIHTTSYLLWKGDLLEFPTLVSDREGEEASSSSSLSATAAAAADGEGSAAEGSSPPLPKYVVKCVRWCWLVALAIGRQTRRHGTVAFALFFLFLVGTRVVWSRPNQRQHRGIYLHPRSFRCQCKRTHARTNQRTSVKRPSERLHACVRATTQVRSGQPPDQPQFGRAQRARHLSLIHI